MRRRYLPNNKSQTSSNTEHNLDSEQPRMTRRSHVDRWFLPTIIMLDTPVVIWPSNVHVRGPRDDEERKEKIKNYVKDHREVPLQIDRSEDERDEDPRGTSVKPPACEEGTYEKSQCFDSCNQVPEIGVEGAMVNHEVRCDE